MTDEEAELAGMAQSDRPAKQRDVHLLSRAIRKRQDVIEDQDRESHGWTAFLVVLCTAINLFAIIFSDTLREIAKAITMGAQ